MPQRIVAQPFFRPADPKLRYLPECPRVLAQPSGSVGWVSIQYAADIPAGGLNILDLASRANRHIPLPGRPGFFVPGDHPGELIIGLERRLVRFDVAAGRITATLAHLPDDPRVIINEGVAIPGGIFFGTKDLKIRDPIAALYHFDFAADTLRELLPHQVCSNGKWLHDGLLVDIDSGPRTITEYRYDGVTLNYTGLIAGPDELPAIPDGLRPTSSGESIVVAFVDLDPTHDGIAQELRLSDGAVLTEWIFPGSPRVSCPEFIELDGRPHLLFTTATEGSESPESGTLFVASLP
jgi:sugar lactone lactonase YvrE